jgi:hypothetical protein
MYRESPPPMKALLRHLAAHPETTFTAKELAEVIGRKRKQFPGVLGAYGRRVRNRYSMAIWPFRAEHSPENRMFTYEMDNRRVAEIIRQVADRS